MKTPMENRKPVNLIQFMLLTFLLVFSLHVKSAEDYNNYLADLYLLESLQVRNPAPVIRYADEKYGVLLRVVLNPPTVSTMMDKYFIAAKGRDNSPNLLLILSPIQGRYERAFIAQPRLYESEYLDCLEISAHMLKKTIASVNTTGNAMPSDHKLGSTPEERRVMKENLEKLGETAKKMSAFANRMIADGIRKKVEKKMFSAEGAKRALAIADSLSHK